MLISGDTQGVAQLVSSVSSALDNQAAQEKPNQSSGANQGEDNGGTAQGGDSFEDSESKQARTEVGLYRRGLELGTIW